MHSPLKQGPNRKVATREPLISECFFARHGSKDLLNGVTDGVIVSLLINGKKNHKKAYKRSE